MMVLSFVISFFFIISGVDMFLFFLSFFFLCELYFGLEFGYMSGVFFCGGWGFVLCILSIVVVILMYWGGGLFNIFSGFYVFFLWLIFISLMVCFKSNSFFIFYFGFEFVVVPIFFLVIFFGYSVDRVLSSLYMFLYTILTSLPFLMFLFYNDLFFGTLSFIYVELSNSLEVCYYWWVFMMFVVFLVKYPIYMFHLWLPSAHVDAPVSGSMILAGVMLKLGAYGILSLMVFSFSCFFYISFLLSSLGLMGVFLICFSIFRYLDISVLVAYSSIVHMGFVLVSFLYGFEFGVLGGNFMLLAHGLCSSALFYVLSLSYECYFSRSLVLVRGGLILSPVLSYWWFFLCLSNMGCPPTFNFFSEIVIMWSLLNVSYIFLFIFFIVGFLVGVYCMYMYSFFNHGLMLSVTSFFSISHLENNIVFLHCCPVLFCFFFLWECF